MMDKKYYLTKEGLEKTKREYEKLREERRAKLKESAPEVFHSGDLNPEYLSFRKELGEIEERLAKLEIVLRDAEITKPPQGECKEVRLGARITIEASGQIEEFILVGTMEADPALGKISNESPVGKALLGCKEGDMVVVSSRVEVTYKIKKVYYDK